MEKKRNLTNKLLNLELFCIIPIMIICILFIEFNIILTMKSKNLIFVGMCLVLIIIISKITTYIIDKLLEIQKELEYELIGI